MRARVRQATGNVRQLIHGAEPVDVASLIAWVEIEPGDGGYFLFYVDATGDRLADTWHESEERAKAQARFELAITDDDWTDEGSR